MIQTTRRPPGVVISSPAYPSPRSGATTQRFLTNSADHSEMIGDKQLEGPGSEARLKALQARFQRIGSSLGRKRKTWPFALLCVAVFLSVFGLGLWLTA